MLDIVDGKALLLAGALFQMNFDVDGSTIWMDSSLRAHLNSRAARGFLQDANFTADEAAAINTSVSATGDSVFLLSGDEALSYLPDADMRRAYDKEWLLRSPRHYENVETIGEGGEYGGSFPAFIHNKTLCWVRPAMWVDLSMLTHDPDANTLVPKPNNDCYHCHT